MGASGNPAKKQQAKVTHRPATLDRLKSKKGITRRIPVYLDGDLVDAFREAEAEWIKATTDPVLSKDQDLRDVLKTAMEEAKEALDEQTDWLILKRPVITVDGEELRGRKAYEWLISDNPPTEAQNEENQKQYKQDAPYNADTFPAALISACLDEPRLDTKEVAELIEEWSTPEILNLFAIAMEVSNTNQVGYLGKGSGGMSGS